MVFRDDQPPCALSCTMGMAVRACLLGRGGRSRGDNGNKQPGAGSAARSQKRGGHEPGCAFGRWFWRRRNWLLAARAWCGLWWLVCTLQ